MRKWIVGIIGILISAFLIYYISKKISFSDSWEQIRKISFWQFAVLMLVYLSSFFPRALRWKLMLGNYPNIGFDEHLSAILIGFFGNNFLPARGGELLRMEFFSRNTSVPRVTTLTSVFAEKIIDGLTLLFFLIFSLFFSQKDLLNILWLKNLLIVVTAIFVVTSIILLLLKTNSNIFFEVLKKIPSKSIQVFIEKIVIHILNALHFLNFDLNSLKILLLSIVIWLIEAVVFMLAINYLNIPLPTLLTGFLVLVIVNFGILIPSAPAYLGVFQGMTVLSLSIFNISNELGLILGIIVHFSQFLPVSVAGLIFFMLYAFKERKQRKKVELNSSK
ncbi:MAG: lysylphosphatidylglycerol synthase transmembrane domain-containing protein [Bacteroidota bacterium]